MRKFEFCNGYENKAVLPTRATKNSAGYDISIIVEQPTIILPNKSVLFPTGIKVYMESNDVLLVYIRSSFGVKHDINLSNGVCVIDADYVDNPKNEGNILVGLRNVSNNAITLPQGVHRVAQGIFTKYLITDADDSHATRVGGIGSTGV